MLSAAIVHTLLVGDETQALKNALFSPDLLSAVYLLFPRENNLLYAIRLTQEAMKKHFIIKNVLAADFRRWWESFEKCVLIGNI